MDITRLRTARPVARLTEGRRDWYSITNKADGPAQVRIYDEIGYLAVTAQDFLNELADVQGDIELHLNSPGGDVFDGIAIYNGLRQRDGQVNVIVDSLAASVASVIAMAASPGQLKMAGGSQMMIHDGFAMCIGNEQDMRELADLLGRQSDNIASIYAGRTGQPASHWRKQMQAETWYTAQEAVQAGLADTVLGQKATRNSWDLSVFRNADDSGVPAVNPDNADQADLGWLIDAFKEAI